MSDELPDRPVESTEILRVLVGHRVEFVVIGGIAVQTHGHLRTTKDLDVVPEPTRENWVRLAAALSELEAGLRGVDAHLLGIDVTDPDHLEEGGNFTLDTKHGWLDVFPPDLAKGAPPYPELRRGAVVVGISGVTVAVTGLDHLLSMKRAAGRPIDLEDIAVLTADTPPPAGA